MQLRRISFENGTVLAVMDDADNVIAKGFFETQADIEEATRMTGVLLANLGFIEKTSSGILPMPYEKFRKVLDGLIYKGGGKN